jgi:hypothetical protein
VAFEPKHTRAQGVGERLLLLFQETFEAGCDSGPRTDTNSTLNRDESSNVDSFRVVIFYFV